MDLRFQIQCVVLVVLCVVGYLWLKQSAKPVEPLDDAWFQSAVVDRPGPVLVKFGAPGAGPAACSIPRSTSSNARAG